MFSPGPGMNMCRRRIGPELFSPRATNRRPEHAVLTESVATAHVLSKSKSLKHNCNDTHRHERETVEKRHLMKSYDERKAAIG